MILKLAINKIEPGLYQAAVLSGGGAVTAPSMYPSIEDAIRGEAAAVPDGFAHFADVVYGGASSGTIALSVRPARAAEVADQLVVVVAEMHRVAEL